MVVRSSSPSVSNQQRRAVVFQSRSKGISGSLDSKSKRRRGRRKHQCCYFQLGLLGDENNDDNAVDEASTTNQFSIEEMPLNQIFQKGVVLQRCGDRVGALREYNHFLQVAETHNVDRALYAEVYANMAAIYAMQGKNDSGGSAAVNNANNMQVDSNKQDMRVKAKEAFQQAVKYRPSLGSAWVNLALLQLAEGKELGTDDQEKVKSVLKEARQCCERALGLDNDDERSRSLANKLIGDIDSMMKQMK